MPEKIIEDDPARRSGMESILIRLLYLAMRAEDHFSFWQPHLDGSVTMNLVGTQSGMNFCGAGKADLVTRHLFLGDGQVVTPHHDIL